MLTAPPTETAVYPDLSGPGGAGAEGYLENKTLAPAERDLLYFLLRYGTERMEFESDSPYYAEEDEDKITVAAFIREALDADDCCFSNSAYKSLYDNYMRLYDEGLQQDAILRALLNGEDRSLAAIAASFSTEKYQLTVGACAHHHFVVPCCRCAQGDTRVCGAPRAGQAQHPSPLARHRRPGRAARRNAGNAKAASRPAPD